MSDEKVLDQGFGWDDEVEEATGEFKLLPEGDYKFTVTKFDRGWYEAGPGAKIASCNQADLEFSITWKDEDGEVRTNTVRNYMKLSRKLQWVIYEFFESIGLRKKGDGSTKMPWDKVMGATGICQIGTREHNNRTYNQVTKCYPVEDAPKVYQNSDLTEEDEFKL